MGQEIKTQSHRHWSSQKSSATTAADEASPSGAVCCHADSTGAQDRFTK